MPPRVFRQMASSFGAFTLMLETLTLRQASKSSPSRLVSILTLSTVILSTPVARIAQLPPQRREKSRRVTLRDSLQGDGLVAHAAAAKPDERLAADQAASHDGYIGRARPPDQAPQGRIVGGWDRLDASMTEPGSSCRVMLLRRRIEPVR
jgi:hypothetical protein